mgnify:CR=1 FL=1
MQKQVFETLVQTASILDNLEINPKAHTTVLNYIVVLSQIQICPLLAKKGLIFKRFKHIVAPRRVAYLFPLLMYYY